MKSYLGSPKIKEIYVNRVKAHRIADEIIKGRYWEKGKGCAVGCTIHGSDHARYEIELGIPRILAELEDGIFETLPNVLAMTWPERFLEAIEPGKDLSFIWPQFAYWLLADPIYGMIQFAKTARAKKPIQVIIDLYQREINGETISLKEWNAADGAAAYAAASAADADAYAYAYAAASAADAAAAAAYAAADANAYAYAASAAAAASSRTTEWRIAQSEKLLELLRSTQ